MLRPPKLNDDGTYTIELTQDYFATVDAVDLVQVSGRNWSVQRYKDSTRSTKVYAKCAVSGTHITMHRFILSPSKGTCVDHINGNGLDNRRCNLRLATKSQNAANRPKDRLISATSKYKGVYRCRGRWIARIEANRVVKHLGVFKTEEDAARAYDEAATNYFGSFAYRNFNE